MKQKRSKSLQEKVNEAIKGIKCPIHLKEPKITLSDNWPAEATAECCCISFKTDVMVTVNRVVRAWNLHGEHLRARKRED